jgi:hypothetical protein
MRLNVPCTDLCGVSRSSYVLFDQNLSILILYESWGMRIGYFSSLMVVAK